MGKVRLLQGAAEGFQELWVSAAQAGRALTDQSTEQGGGMTPVNRKAGTGERTRELPGGNAWDLYSPVGFRHH